MIFYCQRFIPGGPPPSYHPDPKLGPSACAHAQSQGISQPEGYGFGVNLESDHKLRKTETQHLAWFSCRGVARGAAHDSQK